MDNQHVAGKANAVVDCQGCHRWIANQPGEILVLKITCTGLKLEEAVVLEGVSTFHCNISMSHHCPIAPMPWHGDFDMVQSLLHPGVRMLVKLVAQDVIACFALGR